MKNLLEFNDVVKDCTGGNVKVKQSNYLSEGLLPVVDQGKILVAGYVNDKSMKYKGSLPCVIFGDHTCALKYVDFNFVLGADGTKVLVPNPEKIDTKYLFYFLKTVYIPESGYSRHFKYLKRSKIPAIPLSQQRQTVKSLDASDRLRQKRKEQLALLDDYLKSVFLEMFGDPANNYKNYPVTQIRKVVKEVKYGTSKKADQTKGKYPILRMNNITYSGEWNLTDLKYIDLEENEIEKYMVEKGDLLFNRTNSKELVGKTAVFNDDRLMAYAGYLIRCRFDTEKMSPIYASHFLNSAYGKSKLTHMCKNIVGMANINAQELQDIELVCPPIEEQTKFTLIVNHAEQIKQKMRASLGEMDNHFNALMQRYFG